MRAYVLRAPPRPGGSVRYLTAVRARADTHRPVANVRSEVAVDTDPRLAELADPPIVEQVRALEEDRRRA